MKLNKGDLSFSLLERKKPRFTTLIYEYQLKANLKIYRFANFFLDQNLFFKKKP